MSCFEFTSQHAMACLCVLKNRDLHLQIEKGHIKLPGFLFQGASGWLLYKHNHLGGCGGIIRLTPCLLVPNNVACLSSLYFDILDMFSARLPHLGAPSIHPLLFVMQHCANPCLEMLPWLLISLAVLSFLSKSRFVDGAFLVHENLSSVPTRCSCDWP